MEIYLDGASLEDILQYNEDPMITGFTTNPSLLKKAGVANYKEFAKKLLKTVTIKPVSFEVLSDDIDSMYSEALVISGWGTNVYVKIPVSTTKGECTATIVEKLSSEGVKINVTAVTSNKHIIKFIRCLKDGAPSIISIFAGRIADALVNPVPFVSYASSIRHQQQKILWASAREAYNYVQAKDANAQIITVSKEIFEKINSQANKPLEEISLEVIKKFREDAESSGYEIL